MFPLAHQWPLLPKYSTHSLDFANIGRKSDLLFGVSNDFVPVEGSCKPLLGVRLLIRENTVS